MIKPSGDLVIREEPPDRWVLQKSLTFLGNTGTEFTVPAGFVTDLASVPRLLSWLIPKTGSHNRAAVLHDLLWRVSKAAYGGDLMQSDGAIHLQIGDGRVLKLRPDVLVDPVDVDGLFRRAMRESGVNFVRRWLMWGGVRIAAIADGRKGDMKPAHWVQLAATVAPVLLPLLAAVGTSLAAVL